MNLDLGLSLQKLFSLPIRQLYDLVRIDKQRAIKKKRLPWRDAIRGGVSAYDIAEKHRKDFARAFISAMRGLLPENPSKEFREAWESQSLSQMVSALPLFQESEQEKTAERFQEALTDAYLAVINESGEDEAKHISSKFRRDIQFPKVTREQIGKAEKKVKETKVVPIIAVNPRAINWVKQSSLKLIKEGVSETQMKTVRAVIDDGFTKGLRAEELYEKIKGNIGLTDREYRAVENRRALHESAGLPKKEVERLTGEYQEEKLLQRAERIARTETIAAQAEGRQEVWQEAQDKGELPAVVRQWIAAPISCEICLALDGQETELSEPFTLDDESYDNPPAHPHCGCTVVLNRAEEVEGKPPEEKPVEEKPIEEKPTEEKPERSYEVDHKQWLDGLTQKEIGVLDDWSIRAFADIRKVDAMSEAARSTLTDKKLIAASRKLETLNKTLAKAPSYSGELFRGLSYIPREEATAKFTAGQSFKFDALGSWSRNEAIAGTKFAKGGIIDRGWLDSSFFGTGQKADTVGILFRTKIEGKGAVDISKAVDSVYSVGESEVVMQKGKSFVVEKINWAPDKGKLIVDLIEAR